jgi:hypothetical protein
VTLEIGDKVVVYSPPTKVQESKAWMAKHELQWVGPCAVTKIISKSVYTVADIHTQRKYTRHIKHLWPYPAKPWNSANDDDTLDAKGNLIPYYDNRQSPLTINEVTAFFFTGEEQVMLGRVIESSDNTATLHIITTTGKFGKKTKFRAAYVDRDDNKLVLTDKPRQQAVTTGKLAAWTALDIPLKNIMARNITFTAAGNLTSQSFLKIRSYKMHRAR